MNRKKNNTKNKSMMDIVVNYNPDINQKTMEICKSDAILLGLTESDLPFSIIACKRHNITIASDSKILITKITNNPFSDINVSSGFNILDKDILTLVLKDKKVIL